MNNVSNNNSSADEHAPPRPPPAAPPVVDVEAGLPPVVDVEAGLPRVAAPRPGFGPEVIMIDSIDSLYIATACIRARANDSKLIAVDLEGYNLGSEGTICIVQITTSFSGPVFLFDIVKLGPTAFTTEALKGLLEDDNIQKILFDVRADANALFFLYGVSIKNVLDLQLVDAANMRLSGNLYSKLNVNGLARLLTDGRHGNRANLNDDEKLRMEKLKKASKDMFIADDHIWELRPLNPTLLEYCTDTIYFFPMYESYKSELNSKFSSAPWLVAVLNSSQVRLDWAHSDDFPKRSDKSEEERRLLVQVPSDLTKRLKRYAVSRPPRRGMNAGGGWVGPNGH
jgi:exonuclease 3'-5' domain-containing protein 1